MATKKTSTKKKTPAKGGTKSAAKEAQKRPVRREVWGIVLLILALCVIVSYFQIQAIFIDWFALLIKGLIGYGYYLMGPALLMAALILLFHHGRPVRLRTDCTLLLPVLFGSLVHMVASPSQYNSSLAILRTLWKSGQELQSGGAISGTLAVGSIAVFSKVASIIIFTALLAVLLMVSLRITVGAIIEKNRNRARYEEEPDLEVKPAASKKTEPAIRVVPIEDPPKLPDPEKEKPVIDIPLDGEAPREEPKKSGLLTGFFRHKSEQQQTPDQILSQKAPSPAVPEPAAAAAAVAGTAAVAAELPQTGKKTSAKEVETAAAQVTQEIEQKLSAEDASYRKPPLTLLDQSHPVNYTAAGAELRNNSRRLAETLSSFGVEARPGDVVRGPTVTRYEFTLDQGVKLSKITNLSDDIALALGASGVRIAPIPNKISVVGIEVPNKQVTSVLIRDVLESKEFADHSSNVSFAVGKDIGGSNIIGDISKLPHVLIAGTTGSGKSVCTNSLIVSMLYKSTPDEVRFIMVDPKMVELAPYNGIPHLLIPVVTDPKKAAGALQWAVFEMMKRYRLFSEHNVKDLAGYNALAGTDEELETIPTVVVVIDELADLMLVAAKEVEESICRVAQMGRAAGVHLVIATQRPSADVITGIMKANIPSRIAFAVASSLESRIILDTQGAEKLIGRGDMLYFPLGSGKPTRVQGCLITPEEIERVVDFVKQSGEPHYSDEVIQKIEESLQEKEKPGSSKGPVDTEADAGDELLPAAVDVVLETGQASVSMLQRRLKLGYSRAARLVDQMEERGIVGPFEGSKPRQLLITRERWQELQMRGENTAAARASEQAN